MYIYLGSVQDVDEGQWINIAVVATSLEVAIDMVKKEYPQDAYNHSFPTTQEITWGSRTRTLAWEVLDTQKAEIIEY